MSWFNVDKLLLKFGTEKAVPTVAGEYRTYTALHEVEVKVDLTTISSSSTTPTILSDVLTIPKNSRIQEIVVIGETAATSSGNGTIDIGLIQNSDRATEIDFNGLVAAMPKTAVDSLGEQNTINVNSTSVGALVGTTVTQIGLLCANTNTAIYQTGVLKVKVRYYRT